MKYTVLIITGVVVIASALAGCKSAKQEARGSAGQPQGKTSYSSLGSIERRLGVFFGVADEAEFQ